MWFLLLVVAVGLIGIAASFASLVKLWRKGRVGKIVSIAISGGIIFFIYSDIYPPESFYKGEFEKVTGLPFPVSGRFLFKEATYPDFHGDYTSCALIDVSEKDYQDLKSKMKPRQSSLGGMGSQCMQHLAQSFGSRAVAFEASADDPRGEYIYWALVAGRREVIVHYVTW